MIGAEVLGSPDKVGGRITVCTSSHDGGEVGITRVASITTTSSINDVASVDGKVIVASGSGVGSILHSCAFDTRSMNQHLLNRLLTGSGLRAN